MRVPPLRTLGTNEAEMSAPKSCLVSPEEHRAARETSWPVALPGLYSKGPSEGCYRKTGVCLQFQSAFQKKSLSYKCIHQLSIWLTGAFPQIRFCIFKLILRFFFFFCNILQFHSVVSTYGYNIVRWIVRWIHSSQQCTPGDKQNNIFNVLQGNKNLEIYNQTQKKYFFPKVKMN